MPPGPGTPLPPQVELGSRNHEVVPTSLITSLANLRNGGAHKVISTLAKAGLIAKEPGNKWVGRRLLPRGEEA